jgi:iron complex outermembrane receptor protein
MTKIIRSRLIYYCLSIALAQTVQAAQEDLLMSFGDEAFVSIATGQQQAISEAPAVATVITAREIEAMGASNLDQVLETVPGLHVALSSYRFSPIYSLRGIHTDANPQVLMLVNGTPLTQLYFGDRGARNVLPVSNISRVEVIRGPGSAVYGADAFSGVINVITKTREQIDGTELGVRAGSFNTREMWLLNGSRWGEVDVALSINLVKTDGDSGRVIDVDAQSLIDNTLQTAASNAPGEADTDERRVDLRIDLQWQHWKFSAWNWRQDGGVGPGLAQALDPGGEAKTNNFMFDLGFVNRDRFDHWEIEAKLSYADINTESEQTLFPAGTVLPLGEDGNINLISPVGIGLFVDGLRGNPAVYEEHRRFDSSAFYTGFSRHSLRVAAGMSYVELHGEETKNYGPGVLEPVLPQQVVGGELTSVTGSPFNFIPDENRTVFYASLQDEWSIAADWSLTLGVRYDHYSDFGSTVNPRAALVWNARQDLTAKFLYGRAFRAPSFAELFVINNPVALGNPDLDPETINTYEIAFDYRPTFDLRTGLNIYVYQIDDLIQFVPEEGGSQQVQNTGGQSGHGFELEAEWSISDSVFLQAHYALQRSEYDDRGQDVGNAPQHQIYANVNWEFAPDWDVSGQAKWIAGRQRDADDTRDAIDDYTLASLVLRRSNIVNHLDVALVVDNLFAAEAYEPSLAQRGVPEGSLVPGDFPLPGRGIYGKLEYKF